MRSQELLLEKYDSDKLEYLKRYDPFFTPLVNEKISLLELGIYKGDSLLLWHDYFPFGNIVGIDINIPKSFVTPERVYIFEGSQADCHFLSNVSKKTAPNGYDIIIDDASHIGELTKTAFWYLFDNHLKPGGIYIIEDWGTGYWQDWPDGMDLALDTYQKEVKPKTPMPNHSFGMVGLIKQLIDEQGVADVTRGKRRSKFDNMLIAPSVVIVRKAA